MCQQRKFIQSYTFSSWSNINKSSSTMPTIPCGVRSLAPIVATAATAGTLVTCVVLTKTRDVFVGGLHWPYFSDMGRDPPGYYVFCVGLSLVAISLGATWVYNALHQRAVLTHCSTTHASAASVIRASTTATVVALLAILGLPILAFFDTSNYPATHNYAAYAFFLLQTIAISINTVVSFKILSVVTRIQDDSSLVAMSDTEVIASSYPSLRRTYRRQQSTFVLFFIAFLIYLPIGLSIIKPFERLSIQECLRLDLGDRYCQLEMKLDTNDTKLWNYENDLVVNQLCAGAQLACILTLVGYTLSFRLHRNPGDHRDNQRSAANSIVPHDEQLFSARV